MTDNFGRKINYARISLTDRCNLRCQYCMPEGGIDKKECEDILKYEEIENIIFILKKLGITKIRFTGGEPFFRKDSAIFLESIIKKFTDIDFFITTNGLKLSKYTEKLYYAGLKGINISLDTLNHEKYKSITRGGDLRKVLEGLDTLIQIGQKKVKINAVLTKNTTYEDIKSLAMYSIKYPIDVRFIELMPIGECANYAVQNYIRPKIIFEALPDLKNALNEDKHSPAKYYSLSNSKANIGIISPISCKFCSDCNRIRITADGKIKHCLHSDIEFDLKKATNNLEIENLILMAINEKPKQHNLENQTIKRDMKRIGG